MFINLPPRKRGRFARRPLGFLLAAMFCGPLAAPAACGEGSHQAAAAAGTADGWVPIGPSWRGPVRGFFLGEQVGRFDAAPRDRVELARTELDIVETPLVHAEFHAEPDSATHQTQPAAPGAPAQRPITALTANIQPAEGDFPRDWAREALRPSADVEPPAGQRWRHYCWESSALLHRPLYFEDVNLERYGVCCKGTRWLQPAVSGARFFATVPALPYLMWARSPCEPVYTLGHDRPGNCVPFRPHYPELSLIPSSVEAAVISGAVLLVP